MSISLPSPSPQYDANNESQMRSMLEQADAANQKRVSDVVIFRNRLILTATNGSRWQIVVSNTGALSTVAL